MSRARTAFLAAAAIGAAASAATVPEFITRAQPGVAPPPDLHRRGPGKGKGRTSRPSQAKLRRLDRRRGSRRGRHARQGGWR